VREIVYRHAKHISEKDLEGLTGLRKGTPLDPVTNKSACFKIQDYLREKGYYFANVVLEEGDKATDERVVFNVTEGPIVRVRSTNFVGQEELASAARLRTQRRRHEAGRVLQGERLPECRCVAAAAVQRRFPLGGHHLRHPGGHALQGGRRQHQRQQDV
jgi:hemolysin activation/secretion protein